MGKKKENGNGHGYQHLYAPNQLAHPILQELDSPEDPFNPILLEKAQKRAALAEDLFERMMRGERPNLQSGYEGGGRGAKWARADVEKASADGRLTEHPDRYYSLEDPIVKMGYNPAPHTLLESAEQLEKALSSKDIAVRVLGTKRHLPDSKIKTLQRTSDMMIAVPGDLRTSREMAEVIRRKYEGADLKPLIIENSADSFDPFLANLQLLEYEDNAANIDERRRFVDFDKLARKYGIYITHDREQTIEIAQGLRKLQVKQGKTLREKVSPDQLIPEGATIFVATATRKKYNELKQIYEQQGLKVNILPIDTLVDGFISPKEESRSYEGNAAEKVNAAFEAWDRMSPTTQVRRLEDLGKRLYQMGRKHDATALKEEEIFFVSEDSGFHFVQADPNNGLNISTAMDFAGIAHKIDPRAPFPGVETGPGILGEYGVGNFFDKASRVIDRFAEQGHNVSREVVKKSVIALAQLKPSPGSYDAHTQERSKKMVMYSAETRGKFIRTPCPRTGSIEIDNFIIPNGGKKTEAELGDKWYTTRSPRALAWQGLVFDQNIDRDPTIEHPPLREKEYKIAVVSDQSHHAARNAINTLVATNRLPEFTVDNIHADITHLSDVQTKMLEGKDAVVLAFDPERAQVDFWRNVWTFSSLIVGEQTRDKYKLEKPVYLVNPTHGKDGAFDYLETITHDLHILGTIAQDPATLFHTVSSTDEAIERFKLECETSNYLRYDPPEYSKGPFIEPVGDESPKDFNVAIFVSATNENDMIRGVSRELATMLAKDGFGVFSGAGLYSGMGVITRTLMSMRDEVDSHHTGFNVPHIMDAGEVKGKNITEQMDQFHLCRDIYERIEGLISADACIVAPGGMGTIQELAGFAYLKELAIRNPENLYVRDMKHKELVLINTPIKVESKSRGFYDELVKVMPAEDLQRLGIHIVQTSEEAMKKMRELREKKRATPERVAGDSDHARH